jgi:histidine phosphotransferase ChpT
MTLKSSDLTALISSRICHDLSSPVGAINNGVELLGGFNATTSPEMELIAQSVASANAKIRYFRIAFGKAAETAEMRANELGRLCDAMFTNGRFKVSFQVGADNLSRLEGKIILLLVLCLETTLPLGGMVNIYRDATGWRLTAQAKRVNANPDLWALLCEGRGTDMLGPSQVQFALARGALETASLQLETEFGQSHVVLRTIQTG